MHSHLSSVTITCTDSHIHIHTPAHSFENLTHTSAILSKCKDTYAHTDTHTYNSERMRIRILQFSGVFVYYLYLPFGVIAARIVLTAWTTNVFNYLNKLFDNLDDFEIATVKLKRLCLKNSCSTTDVDAP